MKNKPKQQNVIRRYKPDKEWLQALYAYWRIGWIFSI